MRIEYSETGSVEVPYLGAFRGRHPDARVLSVDGRCCLGDCPVCGGVILDGDVYLEWPGGFVSCHGCRGGGHDHIPA